MGLFNLIFTLGVNRRPLDQGLSAAGKRVSEFGNMVRGHFAGMFAPTAIIGFMKNLADATGRIKDLAQQTGITTDEMQKTDWALHQSGQSFEDLVNVMNRLAQARRDAVEGNTELRTTFEKFGVPIKDLNNANVRNFDLLTKISEALSKSNVTGREQAEIMDILGMRAGKLANTLADLKNTTPVELISREQIESIDAASKALDRLQRNAQARGAGIAGPIAENLNKAIEQPGMLSRALATARAINPFTAAPDIFARLVGKATTEPGLGGVIGGELSKMVASLVKGAGGPDELFKEDKNKKETKIAKDTSQLFGRAPSDQLISVGNFLGGSGNGVEMRLDKLEQRLQQIERNTKRVADGAVVIRK